MDFLVKFSLKKKNRMFLTAKRKIKQLNEKEGTR